MHDPTRSVRMSRSGSHRGRRRGLAAAVALVVATAMTVTSWASPRPGDAAIGAPRHLGDSATALVAGGVSDVILAAERTDKTPDGRDARGRHRGAPRPHPGWGHRNVLVSPRPRQHVSGNTVHIVVRAGNEANDVQARLNGEQVGQYFGRTGHGKRVLDAGAGIGLRHGPNVLSVTASHGGPPTGHTVVHFTVTSRRPLVGATPTLRVPVGSVAKVPGTVRVGATRDGGLTSGWEVVAAPASSSFVARSAKLAPATSHQGPAPGSSLPWQPLTPVKVPLTSVGHATAPVASFRPDVLGRYVLRVSATIHGRTTTRRVAVDAIPDSPVITVNTNAVADGVPGIRLGETVYPAPPLDRVGGHNVWSGTTTDGMNFHALWQVIAVDRTTLSLRTDASGQPWNRTYGICDSSAGERICRLTPEGLERADVRSDLNALGSATMVIGASQESADADVNQQWGAPDELAFATSGLTAIGFPSDPKLLTGTSADGAAVIGVPGLAPGEATYNADPGGTAVIRGYLTSDANQHFHFLPSERVPFDTNAGNGCPVADVGCTVTQTFGSTTVSGSLPPGCSGYLVSVLNPHGLGVWAHRTFITNSWPDGTHDNDEVVAMTNFINTWAFTHPGDASGNLIVITELGKHDWTNLDWYGSGALWGGLAKAVASVGGTRALFNYSASPGTPQATSGIPYSLIGWGGAGEGQGIQASSGRLRGALVPNQASLSRPVNVNPVTAPAEALAQMVVRKPVTTWPLDDDPGARAALHWIGSQVTGLGAKPRLAYWDQKMDKDLAETIQDRIDDVKYDPSHASFEGQAFSSAQFDTAKQELTTEVGWAGDVYDYLTKLTAPTTRGAKTNVWDNAHALQHSLEADLSTLDKKAQTSLSWLNLTVGLLNIVAAVGGLGGISTIAGGVKTAAASIQLAGTLAAGTFSGGTSPQDRMVQADQVAQEIQREAADAANGRDHMYDMIVSDPTKLQELGGMTYCEPADGNCGPNNEFANTNDAQEMNAAMATRAVDRVLYERLVPLAYPLWHTGPGSTTYYCVPWSNNPFDYAPSGSFIWITLQPHPDHDFRPGARRIREGYVMVARKSLTFGFPDAAILARMFGPVSPSDDASAGGLGLNLADVLPFSPSRFDIAPDSNCGWA